MRGERVRGVIAAAGVPGRAMAAMAMAAALGAVSMPAVAATMSALRVSLTLLPQPCSATNTDPNCIVVKRQVIPTPPGKGAPGAHGKSALATQAVSAGGTTVLTYVY